MKVNYDAKADTLTVVFQPPRLSARCAADARPPSDLPKGRMDISQG